MDSRLTLQTDAGILPYTYGTLNRLLRAGVVTYRYDANGNVVERADQEKTVRYTYDSRNQLTRVDFPDGTWVRYAYDAFGRRVYREESYWQNARQQKTEITHYLYDGLEVLMKYPGTPGEGLPPLAEYYRANGQLLARKMFGFHGRKAPGNEEFLRTGGGLLNYHTDALGSVQALTDRKGEVVVQYSYEVFGEVWAGVMGPYNRYAFTGKEYDPKTGLYYFGARWYDPEVGRWTSQDPVRDGLNWYLYVRNNPLRYVDLWGLVTLDLLRYGSMGEKVKNLQSDLSRLGYTADVGPIDGIFGPRTEAAVRRFQAVNDLSVDGIVGPETRAAIDQQIANAPAFAASGPTAHFGANARISLVNVEADVTRTSASGNVSIIHARGFGFRLDILSLEGGGGLFGEASGSVDSTRSLTTGIFGGLGLGGYASVVKIEAPLGGVKVAVCVVCGGCSAGLGAGDRWGFAWGLLGLQVSSGP